MGAGMKAVKYVLIAIAGIVMIGVPLAFVLALGLMAGFPFALSEDRAQPVGARATFDESADCLDGYELWIAPTDQPRTLGIAKVAACFPTQSAAKERALIACFNEYERNHPDHDGWPEDNMRRCAWDGMVAVPVRNVTTLVFGKVVANPAEPRAGEPLFLRVRVVREDSAAKRVRSPLVDFHPVVEVAVTIDGESVPIESVGVPCVRCAVGCGCERVTNPEHWFSGSSIGMKLTVPEAAEGKRLAITLTAELGETATATKLVTFTVGP
jgi:hypothetical protein